VASERLKTRAVIDKSEPHHNENLLTVLTEVVDTIDAFLADDPQRSWDRIDRVNDRFVQILREQWSGCMKRT